MADSRRLKYLKDIDHNSLDEIQEQIDIRNNLFNKVLVGNLYKSIVWDEIHTLQKLKDGLKNG